MIGTCRAGSVLLIVLSAILSISALSCGRSAAFKADAREVLKELKALESVVQVGVTWQDYSRRLGDAKIKSDAFQQKYAKSPMPRVSQSLDDAMGYFAAAGQAWSAKISGAGSDYAGAGSDYAALARNPYCVKCAALQAAIVQMRKELPPGPSFDQSISDGLIISVIGMSPLWKSASASIADAERALAGK